MSPSGHRRRETIRSAIGQSTADRISVRGFDLVDDLLGEVDFAGVTFLSVVARLPTPDESVVFNSLLVALVEHGLTPSVLASRLTLLGAPESMQGAIAAGLLGVGSTFVGSVEGAARMLQEAFAHHDKDSDLDFAADSAVEPFVVSGRHVPGLGHPVHRDADPRAAKLFAIAEQHGCGGRHIELLHRVRAVAEQRTGKQLPINATGAIAAIASNLGIPWQISRALGVIARAGGLAGHLLEEMTDPIAYELWLRVDEEASGRDGNPHA